jgi:fatty-acyl-CoA synthase
MLISMLEHPEYPHRDITSLGAVCSGGSTVPAPLVDRIEKESGAAFTIVFGQTECSPVASMTSPQDTTIDKTLTLGSPMPHTEVKIIDPETGDILPCGEPGEYLTRGYHVMMEYFDMPEATAAAIDDEGWLHTGDLCMMDERGYTRIEGRLKDMIIRGGENIYPREIEDVLFEHDSIAEVAVIGLPDEKWGETVAVVLRSAPGVTLRRQELFDYVRSSIAPHKAPRDWFIVDEFPLTGSGKIQKFKLQKMSANGELTRLD